MTLLLHTGKRVVRVSYRIRNIKYRTNKQYQAPWSSMVYCIFLSIWQSVLASSLHDIVTHAPGPPFRRLILPQNGTQIGAPRKKAKRRFAARTSGLEGLNSAIANVV